MIQRLPKTTDTHAARMALWRALGDLYLQVLKQPGGRGGGLPGGGQGPAGRRGGAGDVRGARRRSCRASEEEAIAALRRALPNTHEPAQGVSAAGGAWRRVRKDYDGGVAGGAGGRGAARRGGGGRAGDPHQAGALREEEGGRPSAAADRPALADAPLPPEGARAAGRADGHPLRAGGPPVRGALPAVPDRAQEAPDRRGHARRSTRSTTTGTWRACWAWRRWSCTRPFLVATRERMAKRTNEPAPEPIDQRSEMLPHPPGVREGGRQVLRGAGQKEVYYLLGRTLALAAAGAGLQPAAGGRSGWRRCSRRR